MNANPNGQFREDEVVVRRSKINGEWVDNRYVKVGGKLRVLHQENEHVSIMTEILRLETDHVVSKATVTTTKGTFTGIGVATLNMDARIGDAIASLSETRAVARACRHAGDAMDSCGAEELAFAEMDNGLEQNTNKRATPAFGNDNGRGKVESKASNPAIDPAVTDGNGPKGQDCPIEKPPSNGGTGHGPTPQSCGNGRAAQAQCRALFALTKRAQHTDQDIESMLRPMNAAAFPELSRESASQLITNLQTEVAA